MSDSISITTRDVNIDTPDLGAAGNGAGGTAIDTSTLFTLSTYTTAGRTVTSSLFELGSPVFTRIDGVGMSALPTDIIWVANGCTVRFL